MGRRNLSDSQISYLRGKRYENEKKMNGGQGGNRFAKVQLNHKDEPFNFEYVFQDIPTMIEGYSGLINQSSLARISGINESLMRQYVTEIKRPSRKVTERIESGLKKYADELRNISFA